MGDEPCDEVLGYLAAIGVASVVLVTALVLERPLHLRPAVFSGETIATGWGLIVFTLMLSIPVAIVMGFLVLIPFIVVHRFAKSSDIRSRLFYMAAGTLTGAIFGVALGINGLIAGPLAGAAGAWTFWHLSVRPLSLESPD